MDTIKLGHVTGAHGLSGDLRVHLDNADSEWLCVRREVQWVSPDGGVSSRAMKVRKGPGGRWLARVDGVTDRTAAEAMRGSVFRARREEMPSLDSDEYYLVDVVGMIAYCGQQTLGKVVAVHTHGPVEVFEIKGMGDTWFVPSLKSHVADIDPDERRLEIVDGMAGELE